MNALTNEPAAKDGLQADRPPPPVPLPAIEPSINADHNPPSTVPAPAEAMDDSPFLEEEKGAPSLPADSESWEWDGKSWTVGEYPGSTRTQQFRLRLKDTSGKWRYAVGFSVNFEEYNKRFAGRPGIADKKLKPIRKVDYEKYKEFLFEVWRSEAIRANHPGLRSSGWLA